MFSNNTYVMHAEAHPVVVLSFLTRMPWVGGGAVGRRGVGRTQKKLTTTGR